MERNLNVNQLRMKHRRANKTDVEQLRRDTEEYLAANYAIPQEKKIKTGEDKNLEILADVWEFVAENIEREAWKSYTREQWEELERQYVEKTDYTEPDLFDDILTRYENDEITADEARAEAARYRKCQYRFCENVFIPSRKDKWYCSVDCRKREWEAKDRFEKTGTYLPPEAYKPNRYDTNAENYEEHEIAFNLSEVGHDGENIGDMLISQQHKKVYGGKRNKQLEAIKDITSYKYKDDLKRQKNPVYNEEDRTDEVV